MEKLERLVTERLADRLLTSERVGDLLAGLMDRQSRFPQIRGALRFLFC
jgi:site-specific DNA recombinase